MVQNIKDIGKITELMEEDAFGMLMETNLKEILLMINLMVKVHIRALMEQFIQECG